MNRIGTVLAVCTGSGGIPKVSVEKAQVNHLGLIGDRHTIPEHGGSDRAVCLFAMEDYSKLIAAGVSTDAPGTYGENLLTRGLDYKALRPGDHLHLSGGVKLEIFDIREPCVTLQQLDPRFPDLLIGRSGFLCRVLQEGIVAAGEEIRLDTSDTGRRLPLSQS